MILFDLDGTLVDTAPDLGRALNLQRARYGIAPLPDEVIRPFASHGSKGLLKIGFDLTSEDADFSKMRKEYLNLYDQVFTQSPQLFDGIAELLEKIESLGLHWGVVTNKPRRFTQPLMQAMKLDNRAACIVSGDDAKRAKPAPDTLFLACDLAGVSPATCIYIGDAERDIIAGKSAGMKTVLALYGYISSEDKPEEWGADVMIKHPREVSSMIS